MIHIKTEKELEKMRVAGRLTAIARKAAADAVKPGVTTWEIDRIVRKTIEDAGAKPSFLGYGGFPGSACVSLNDQVIHGIPSKHAVVKEGDIVKQGQELFNVSIMKQERSVLAPVNGIVKRVVKTADFKKDHRMVPVLEGELIVELSPVPKLCPKCSYPITDEHAKFCPFCGTEVSSES